MCQNLGEVVVRHTIENDWEILKMVRLESLLDSPHAFSVTYAAALKYSEADWRARASGRSQYQYILAMQRTRAIGIV
ncbi:GNAT family N-acetyltransferase, partial [Acinetobacter guillouiae]